MWYRFESHKVYNGVDEYDNNLGYHVKVYLYKHAVLKVTPKGVWLEIYPDKKRFVLREAYRRWACPTVIEALESFKARKNAEIGHCRRRIRDAERAIYLAEREANAVT